MARGDGQRSTFEHLRRFQKFDKANPHVMEELYRLAKEWQAAGHTKGSVKMFAYVLRFNVGTRGVGKPIPINDHYTAMYARCLMARDPSLDGFFSIREKQQFD